VADAQGHCLRDSGKKLLRKIPCQRIRGGLNIVARGAVPEAKNLSLLRMARCMSGAKRKREMELRQDVPEVQEKPEGSQGKEAGMSEWSNIIVVCCRQCGAKVTERSAAIYEMVNGGFMGITGTCAKCQKKNKKSKSSRR